VSPSSILEEKKRKKRGGGEEKRENRIREKKKKKKKGRRGIGFLFVFRSSGTTMFLDGGRGKKKSKPYFPEERDTRKGKP